MLLIATDVKSQQEDLSAYKWENRLVVVQNSTLSDGPFLEQAKRLAPLDVSFEDRKLKLIDQRGVAHTNKGFQVLLIGLDGGVKARKENSFFSREELFVLIDSMPMRRYELEQNSPN